MTRAICIFCILFPNFLKHKPIAAKQILTSMNGVRRISGFEESHHNTPHFLTEVTNDSAKEFSFIIDNEMIYQYVNIIKNTG